MSAQVASYGCPLCGTHERRAIASVPEFERCASCGLVCNRHEEPPEGYDGDYFTAEEPAKGHRNFESAAARFYDERRFGEELRMVGSPRPGHRLLDMGSATGVYLDIAGRHGWEAIGVEISADARALAARRGAQSHPGLDDVVDLAPFTLITLHHVLEHLVDPVATLAQLRRLLAENGRILIEVPNWRSAERRSMGSGWTDLRPEQHRWQFEPATLRRVCETAGLEVRAMLTRGEPIPSVTSLARAARVPEAWMESVRRRRGGPIAAETETETEAGSEPEHDTGDSPRRSAVAMVARRVDALESRVLLGKRLVVVAG